MESNYLELVKRVAGNGAKLKYRKLFPLLNLCPVSPPPPAQRSFYSQALTAVAGLRGAGLDHAHSAARAIPTVPFILFSI